MHENDNDRSARSVLLLVVSLLDHSCTGSRPGLLQYNDDENQYNDQDCDSDPVPVVLGFP